MARILSSQRPAGQAGALSDLSDDETVDGLASSTFYASTYDTYTNDSGAYDAGTYDAGTGVTTEATFVIAAPIMTEAAASATTVDLGTALQAAMAGGYLAHLAAPSYTVTSSIVINVNSTIQGPMGIDLGGARIVSQITDGSPVIQLNVGPGVDLRYVTFANFTIEGNGGEGDGIGSWPTATIAGSTAGPWKTSPSRMSAASDWPSRAASSRASSRTRG